MTMKYDWTITDDGLFIWEENVKIAKIDPEQFVFIIADMAQHLKWQVNNGTTNGNVHSGK
jgi:hypothetical protein